MLSQNYISGSIIHVVIGVMYNVYAGTRNVILAMHTLQLPDDGLCKPKHVGASSIILDVLIII